MKIADIKGLIFCRVSIYKECGTQGDLEFTTIYAGEAAGIPESLLEKEIMVIGVKDAKTIDIEIK